ncbi:MAG: 2-oxoacid:acceptor oxidoreductase family protein, partial [bacterium]
EAINASPEGTFGCKFYGLGSDGTVGANKNSIKIIGDNTDMYAQGYFVYDSKKSGGITISHLRFGKSPIKSSYLIDHADLIACHNPSYMSRYDVLEGIKDEGIFLLNSRWSLADMEKILPANVKKTIAKKKLRFYNIDAVKIAEEVGLGNRINAIMQAAFFQISNVIPAEDAIGYIKAAIKKSYGKKGDKIVNMNYEAVDKAISCLEKVDYPAEWANAEDTQAKAAAAAVPAYITDIAQPVLDQKGDKLPVSVFKADGIYPTGTTKYERRGIAINIPVWEAENCIQCNQCAFICPHAAIRPYLAYDKDLASAPADFTTVKASGQKDESLKFRMQVFPMDCTGCGNCVDICAAKQPALKMVKLDEVKEKEVANEQFALALPKVEIPYKTSTVKGSQFLQPLFEFSGACAGCGETPYIKLVTQLFGDRMMVANATGCSSIYGGSAPTCPYTTNEKGHGPAWANSLFEDNAEFGLGMTLAVSQRREKLAAVLTELANGDASSEFKAAAAEWVKEKDNAAKSVELAAKIKALLPQEKDSPQIAAVKEMSDLLVKKSQWIFGGDGWAYDIGYGG